MLMQASLFRTPINGVIPLFYSRCRHPFPLAFFSESREPNTVQFALGFGSTALAVIGRKRAIFFDVVSQVAENALLPECLECICTDTLRILAATPKQLCSSFFCGLIGGEFIHLRYLLDT